MKIRAYDVSCRVRSVYNYDTTKAAPAQYRAQYNGSPLHRLALGVDELASILRRKAGDNLQYVLDAH